jgi:hypothetical protein
LRSNSRKAKIGGVVVSGPIVVVIVVVARSVGPNDNEGIHQLVIMLLVVARVQRLLHLGPGDLGTVSIAIIISAEVSNRPLELFETARALLDPVEKGRQKIPLHLTRGVILLLTVARLLLWRRRLAWLRLLCRRRLKRSLLTSVSPAILESKLPACKVLGEMDS